MILLNEKLILMIPLVLLTVVTSIGTNQAKGWDGPWASYNGSYQEGYGGFCAGQQDAIYDHQNQLQYQPYGQCLPCHSQEYWNNFREGYDQQWSSYQGQSSDQNAAVNVYGNNNAPITVNQYSNQQQNPLQQLAHTVCGWVNCNQGGPDP